MAKYILAVGTTSKLKLDAVKRALHRAGLYDKLVVRGVKTTSGVPEQPLGRVETRLGAANRARAALKQVEGADYGLGIENGLRLHRGQYLDFAEVVLLDSSGTHASHAASASVLCPLEYAKASLATGRTKTAGHFYALAHPGVATATDWHSHATGGRLSRESILTDAIFAALTLAFPRAT